MQRAPTRLEKVRVITLSVSSGRSGESVVATATVLWMLLLLLETLGASSACQPVELSAAPVGVICLKLPVFMAELSTHEGPFKVDN